MKRIFLLGMVLFFIALALPKANAQKAKGMEKVIDETMQDVDRIFGEASAKPQSETAQPRLVPKEAKEPQSPIDLEFNQANLEDVLRIIAEAGGMNIVLDPMLMGKKIDLHLKKISIDEALEVLYNAYGLGSSNIGNNILFISTQEKVKRGTTRTKIVELENINVEDAKALIGNLVNAVNLSKETNTLVIIGASDDINKAEKILKEVDIPQLQVVLEAKVVEINDDFLKELGVDWPDSITTSIQETKRPATLGTTATSLDTPFQIYKLARNAVQFDMVLKMLEQKNKAKVLSSPRITTLNNKEAQIFIGDKIPYTITTVTGGAASTEVRFVEPGIRLKITPSIIEKDFVVIKIEPEVSYIYSWRGTGDQYPWVKAREATAYVRVKNNQPFVLGGLLSQEDKKNLYRIPLLGGIPILGNLFTYEKKIDYNTDLIITVIPTILSEKI